MALQLPKFSVTILGSNSALPANGRHPTAQLLNVNNNYYLIDCGEGTQMQLRRYGLKMQRIEVVFISHMHGDHYFGLVGLLNSMQLLGRTKALLIICPPALEPIVRLQLDAAGARLSYPLQFQFLDEDDKTKRIIYEDDHVKVEAFPLKHRIACHGFLFSEQPRDRTYLPELGGPAGVRIQDIPRLKKGENVLLDNGTILLYEKFTLPPVPVRSYAFCTDTLPLDHVAEWVSGANLLYHEATFLDDEVKRAKETHHSTAAQAATIATKAMVKHLLIGHYSARYTSLDAHLNEAKAVFVACSLSYEGLEVEII
jgi:ribonuclease Z